MIQISGGNSEAEKAPHSHGGPLITAFSKQLYFRDVKTSLQTIKISKPVLKTHSK
jgi:hypothetical protein